MIEVFSVRSPISENDIVTILPLQLVSIREVSDDFSMTFFKVDKEMFLDIMSGLGKITPDFFLLYAEEFPVQRQRRGPKPVSGVLPDDRSQGQ